MYLGDVRRRQAVVRRHRRRPEHSFPAAERSQQRLQQHVKHGNKKQVQNRREQHASHDGCPYRVAAERAGAGRAVLVPKVSDMDWSLLEGVNTIGITAGASAPEALVQQVVAELATRFVLDIEERQVTTEDVTFRLPPPLV